jgi:hypothetical protein
MRTAFPLIFGLLLAIGCTSVVPVGTPAPAATPQIIYVTPAPVATQVAVVTPSPEPTPTLRRATPRPTPRPTPEPVLPSDGFFDFTLEQLEWLDTLTQGSEDIGNAAQGGRVGALRRAVDGALADAEEIQMWLLINPPDDLCYVDLHESWSNYIDEYVAGLDEIDYGLTAPVTWNDVIEGVDMLEDANRLLDDITITMELTDCFSNGA